MHYISFVPTLISWWYGRGLKDLSAFLLAAFDYLQNTFSVKVLLGTLFQPWKKMVEDRGPGLDGLKYWIVDNLISRGVGFIVRLFMIFFFLLATVLYIVFALVTVVFWIAMPAVVLGSFVYIFIN